MTFDAAQQYVYSLLNLPRQEYMNDPAHCQVYLDRLQFFLDIVGNPEKHIPHYIHVTGTSGKGSVSLMLQSILSADNKKTGVMVSPHPTRITERWMIDGSEMSEQEFVSIVTELKPALETYMQTAPYDMLSFFELTTAIGFMYFSKQEVDWAVMEVGCGGRYDSTNIIPHKDVAVITNIGLDHMHLLGDTKEKIAYEKAGIVQRAKAVFTMEQIDSVRTVIEQECRIHDLPMRFIDETTLPTDITSTLSGVSFSYQDTQYTLPHLGAHQVRNAVLCIEIAKSLDISTEAIVEGLHTSQLPIRMEVVSSDPTVILDSAHNEDKMSSTAQTLNSVVSDNAGIHLLLGFSENKDLDAILKTLTPLNPHTITCTRNTINHFRTVMHPKALAEHCMNQFPDAQVSSYLDPAQAFKEAKAQLGKHDILLVTGSVFLAGELRTQEANA